MKRIVIEIDSEELECLIDFHRSMIDGAEESLEFDEVKWREKRKKELEKKR